MPLGLSPTSFNLIEVAVVLRQEVETVTMTTKKNSRLFFSFLKSGCDAMIARISSTFIIIFGQ